MTVSRDCSLILVGRARCPVWEVVTTKAGKIGNIQRKDPMPFVNHYSFHIWDTEWGHVTIKMSGHPPFGAQIILNGHEFVARAARLANIEFRKEGNCFVHTPDGAALASAAPFTTGTQVTNWSTAGTCSFIAANRCGKSFSGWSTVRVAGWISR